MRYKVIPEPTAVTYGSRNLGITSGILSSASLKLAPALLADRRLLSEDRNELTAVLAVAALIAWFASSVARST